MYRKTAEPIRHALKNRVRGLRAVTKMVPEAQAAFRSLKALDVKVYCYPDDPDGSETVKLETGYGQIELRDNDRYDVDLNGVIVKSGCQFHEAEAFLIGLVKKNKE